MQILIVSKILVAKVVKTFDIASVFVVSETLDEFRYIRILFLETPFIPRGKMQDCSQ